MSTKSSLYYGHDDPKGEVHIYHEMHDDLIHLWIGDDSNSQVNVVIPRRLYGVLAAYLRPQADGSPKVLKEQPLPH